MTWRSRSVTASPTSLIWCVGVLPVHARSIHAIKGKSSGLGTDSHLGLAGCRLSSDCHPLTITMQLVLVRSTLPAEVLLTVVRNLQQLIANPTRSTTRNGSGNTMIALLMVAVVVLAVGV